MPIFFYFFLPKLILTFGAAYDVLDIVFDFLLVIFGLPILSFDFEHELQLAVINIIF
jgi:hypothetical protein